jgi:predicted protein tyrosine phosphatase
MHTMMLVLERHHDDTQAAAALHAYVHSLHQAKHVPAVGSVAVHPAGVCVLCFDEGH